MTEKLSNGVLMQDAAVVSDGSDEEEQGMPQQAGDGGIFNKYQRKEQQQIAHQGTDVESEEVDEDEEFNYVFTNQGDSPDFEQSAANFDPIPRHLLSNLQERLTTVLEEETYNNCDGLWQSASFPAPTTPSSNAMVTDFQGLPVNPKDAFQNCGEAQNSGTGSMSTMYRLAFGTEQQAVDQPPQPMKPTGSLTMKTLFDSLTTGDNGSNAKPPQSPFQRASKSGPASLPNQKQRSQQESASSSTPADVATDAPTPMDTDMQDMFDASQVQQVPSGVSGSGQVSEEFTEVASDLREDVEPMEEDPEQRDYVPGPLFNDGGMASQAGPPDVDAQSAVSASSDLSGAAPQVEPGSSFRFSTTPATLTPLDVIEHSTSPLQAMESPHTRDDLDSPLQCAVSRAEGTADSWHDAGMESVEHVSPMDTMRPVSATGAVHSSDMLMSYDSAYGQPTERHHLAEGAAEPDSPHSNLASVDAGSVSAMMSDAGSQAPTYAPSYAPSRAVSRGPRMSLEEGSLNYAAMAAQLDARLGRRQGEPHHTREGSTHVEGTLLDAVGVKRFTETSSQSASVTNRQSDAPTDYMAVEGDVLSLRQSSLVRTQLSAGRGSQLSGSNGVAPMMNDSAKDDPVPESALSSEQNFEQPQQHTPTNSTGRVSGSHPPVQKLHTEDLWDVVTRTRREQAEQETVRAAAGGQKGQPTYDWAVKYFMTVDTSAYHEAVRAAMDRVQPRGGGICSCFGSPPKPAPRIRGDTLQLLSLAKMEFDDANPVHLQMLQGLFRDYFQTRRTVPRYGPHWVDMGFQGEDPATDLRAAGMLALLQLAYLYVHHPHNAMHIFLLSQDPLTGFPLPLVSIHATKWCCAFLRDEGRVSKAFADRGSVLRVANDFYVGCMYALVQRWQQGGVTLERAAVVIKEMEQQCLANVGKTLAKADAVL